MIKAQCFTNIDSFKRENWPSKFNAIPEIGHYVVSESGVRLRIVSVSWGFDGSPRIELHH